MKLKRLPVIAILALAAIIARADTPHTFSLDVSSWEIKPKTLHVAGDFNGWSKTATPLVKKGNIWSATVKLTDGVHAYKFVADGERWLTDPKADKTLDVDDGNGGKNSAVPVGSGATKAVVTAGHRFILDTSSWETQPKSVGVAGSFNGWSKEAAPLQKTGSVWSASVPLADGVYHYKFVIDNERFISDPKGDKAFDEDDTFGGTNSGVLVGPDARKLPPPKPNDVNLSAVQFDRKSASDVNAISKSAVRLRIRVQAGDVEHVYARVFPAERQAWQDDSRAARIELSKLGTALGYDIYGGTATVPKADLGNNGQTTVIDFQFTDGTATARYANAQHQKNTSVSAYKPNADTPFLIDMTPTFVTPDWARDAIWYQIFPERFRNGDAANDPDNTATQHLIRWTSKWYDAQPGEAPGAENFYEGKGNVWNRRYGGDIQGVRQALPYLKKLGVNAIYLNPIFEADSMHKYDTTDFRHVDDNFGVKGDWPVAGETDDPATWKWSASDKVFLDFVAEAHKEGFKVVVDGVFNHVGRPHPFFQDVLANGKTSKYADWFEIIDWGDEKNWHKMDDPYSVHGKKGGIQWRAWDGVNGHLPAFKKSNETGLTAGPADHLITVTKRWLAPDGDPSKGIDGFRLDAANEVPHPFWVRWREEVKKTKPDAYITGEIWSPAQPWINDGKQFDAVMNYQFAMPAQAFFVNQKKAMKPSEFLTKLVDDVYMYPQQASLVMMNLFDSHDTDRLASMFVNPDLSYDGANRLQDSGPKYSTRKPNEIERKRMMQAVACQMTFLGAPMIYYGDEAGMWSADDPSNRQPMAWPGMTFDDPDVKFNQEIFDQYQDLVALREKLPALRRGDFFPVASNDFDGTLVYGRRLGGQSVYVFFNRSDRERLIKVDVTPFRWAREWIGVDGRVVESSRYYADQIPTISSLTFKLQPYSFGVAATDSDIGEWNKWRGGGTKDAVIPHGALRRR